MDAGPGHRRREFRRRDRGGFPPTWRRRSTTTSRTGDTLAIRGRAEGTHTGRFLGLEPTGKRVAWEFCDLYRVGPDGRINWHFYVTDWNIVRLQLLDQTPDLPATPQRRAVFAEG